MHPVLDYKPQQSKVPVLSCGHSSFAWRPLLDSLAAYYGSQQAITVLTEQLDIAAPLQRLLAEHGYDVLPIHKAADTSMMCQLITMAESHIIMVSRASYDRLNLLLRQYHQPLCIVLMDESWTPDWCWRFGSHQFYCLQDI
ncbi:hypothetical protein VST7929_01625 [Vibrio stylophorae]|uniref:Uncharacterized protein n=1 Tax=Vibrio stylophorae TaxID=659351 RepID=A0ABN8DSF9_9VIBR|nr:hypothetical protein [Vibrio stylophorae]CAH0533750.1 hypothetical protein VST7929_01625 [Vibrio stylophorae]